jgi:hypothetical protein
MLPAPGTVLVHDTLHLHSSFTNWGFGSPLYTIYNPWGIVSGFLCNWTVSALTIVADGLLSWLSISLQPRPRQGWDLS